GMAGVNSGSYLDSESRYRFFEIGAQPRWYIQGGFRGWMAGAAVHYFRLHLDITLPPDPYVFAFDFAGYTYGPFFGYKYTSGSGFTVEAKFGMEGIKRTMSDAGQHPDMLPITDLKVGWSF